MGEVKIKVENIKKSFKVGENVIPVLFGIDFEIMRGEFCLLIGPSGCGKSTLLHSIYGLEPPTEGKIIIDGKDIWNYSKDWRAHFRNKNVGFIPQQAFWTTIQRKICEKIASAGNAQSWDEGSPSNVHFLC